MKTILILVLALTVSGCGIASTLGLVSGLSDIVSVEFDPVISDYEVALNEALYICSKEGKKARFRTEPTRTITKYSTADFDCVSLSSNTKTSGNVSNLPVPPDYN